MKFPKQEMLDMLNFGIVIEDNIVGHRRWSVDHEIVFKRDGKFYTSSYSIGATESQDESPWEYDGNNVECTEVCRVTKTVEVWVPVSQESK